jgi:hypothetical protein
LTRKWLSVRFSQKERLQVVFGLLMDHCIVLMPEPVTRQELHLRLRHGSTMPCSGKLAAMTAGKLQLEFSVTYRQPIILPGHIGLIQAERT